MVHPLVEVVKKRDQEIKELKERERELEKSLKTVRAVVRTPKLWDIYHKTERKYQNEF